MASSTARELLSSLTEELTGRFLSVLEHDIVLHGPCQWLIGTILELSADADMTWSELTEGFKGMNQVVAELKQWPFFPLTRHWVAEIRELRPTISAAAEAAAWAAFGSTRAPASGRVPAWTALLVLKYDVYTGGEHAITDVLTNAIRQRPKASRSMLTAAFNILAHPAKAGYYEQLSSALSDPKLLLALENQHAVSGVERNRSRDRIWIVMVHFSLSRAAEELRQRQPSFFISWPKDIPCDSQVHVLDTPIYAKRYCLLIVFRSNTAPEPIMFDKALGALRQELGLAETTRALTTEPVLKDKEAWFRANGAMYVTVRDSVLALGLRVALANNHHAPPR
ncbi:hypothetical protein LTR37_014583 [Vermiconidia calcicola]|uniref:Uncharacterized protein n=1 Tax=Vermiconidia calcicola TaxID=1690605 RepID=A0ACC3MTW9_9PEZI|nr:hypothetical protein LTR37_014583 [Vermiconidia calcicola]